MFWVRVSGFAASSSLGLRVGWLLPRCPTSRASRAGSLVRSANARADEGGGFVSLFAKRTTLDGTGVDSGIASSSGAAFVGSGAADEISDEKPANWFSAAVAPCPNHVTS